VAPSLEGAYWFDDGTAQPGNSEAASHLSLKRVPDPAHTLAVAAWADSSEQVGSGRRCPDAARLQCRPGTQTNRVPENHSSPRTLNDETSI